jgi:hypothetical protein
MLQRKKQPGSGPAAAGVCPSIGGPGSIIQIDETYIGKTKTGLRRAALHHKQKVSSTNRHLYNICGNVPSCRRPSLEIFEELIPLKAARTPGLAIDPAQTLA